MTYAAALMALTVWMRDWLNILAIIGAIFCCIGDVVNGAWRKLARWYKQGIVITQLNAWKATITSSDFVVQAQQDQT